MRLTYLDVLGCTEYVARTRREAPGVAEPGEHS